MNKINQYIELNSDNPFSTQSKMLYHVDRVNQYLFYEDTWPVFMEINLTDNCNLDCEWCISGNRLSDTIDTDKLISFFNQFSNKNGKAITLGGGGEPTLHPDFKKIANGAIDNSLELGLMTNGFFKKEYRNFIGENFKWVRISLDSVNSKKYKEWKGVDAVKIVLDNIESLHDKKVKVGVNCNVNNEMTVEDTHEFISTVMPMCNYIQFRPVLHRYYINENPKLNYDVWFYLYENFYSHPKINFSYDKFKDILGGMWFPFDKCEGHFFSPILNSNGDLMACMYHFGDERFVFGNIYKDNFSFIWKSDRRREVINFVRNLDYKNECQVCCKLYEINKLIHYIKNPDDKMDINFL